MKIVFYNKSILSGGIEKCIELLSKEIYKRYELEVVYTDESRLDMNIVNILKRYAKVYKIEEGMKVDCDICIWCYLYFDYENLKNIINAKRCFTWIHSMPRILPDCLLDNETFVNDCTDFVCVSEAVKNHLDINKEGIVIHNFMAEDIKELGNVFNPFEGIDDNVLKLSVVSRLSNGKGFDRLYLFVKALEDNNIPYNVKVIGKGRAKEQEIKDDFKEFTNVEFVGYKENPYPYVKHSDYLVQLSDDESWCNVITEAKLLNVPVVVTNFESSKEQVINDFNGLIIDLNEKNYNSIVNELNAKKTLLKRNLDSFEFKNEVEEWINLIEKKDV